MLNTPQNFLKKLEDITLIALLGIMGCALLIQVVFRYFLQTPLLWSEELARYLQIWITFGGIGFGIRHQSHVAMSLLKNHLPPYMQHLLEALACAIIIACLVLLFPTVWSFTTYQNRILSSTLHLPMSAVASAVLAGCLISIFYFSVQIIRSVIALYAIFLRRRA